MEAVSVGRATVNLLRDSAFAGSRLVSLEVTFPRFCLAEFNTHRVLSRNSASSRAIPTWKQLCQVVDRPYIPTVFRKNKAGMQAGDPLSDADQEIARATWIKASELAVLQAYHLAGGMPGLLSASKGHDDAHRICLFISDTLREKYPDLSFSMRSVGAAVHKEHASRILEPFLYDTVIVTGTHWRNFIALRANKAAQPEMQDLGVAVALALRASAPRALKRGDWHRPYIEAQDLQEVHDPALLNKASCGRCARVSFLTHDGVRSLEADIQLATSLLEDGHMSPFEHVAQAGIERGLNGNLASPWAQYRKLLEHEDDFSRRISREALLEGLRGDENLADFVLNFPD